MAIKACKECGSEVAANAKNCPHCGVSFPGITKRDQRFIAAGWIALFVALVSTCTGEESPDVSGESSSQPLAVESAEVATESVSRVSYTDVDSVLNEFGPRFIQLAQSGAAMEPYRQSESLNDMRRCADLMHQSIPKRDALRDEFSAAINSLPQNLRYSPELEPLYLANAEIVMCVTCVPAAKADCIKAAGRFGVTVQ